MVSTPRLRQVSSPGPHGVTLAVKEYGGHAAGVHVVLIHGFPDDQSMWTPVLEHLPQDWHLITYDVRGAGGSSRPREVSAYRTDHLLKDFAAVVEATVPGVAPVHVVAHDWGSIAGWDIVAAESSDPRLRGRIASYTSISGPSLDHLGVIWAGPRGKRRLLRQVLHSWYVWLFQLPRLPELTWRRAQQALRPLVRRIDPTIDTLAWGEQVAANAVPSVNLYRANVLQRLRDPRPWRTGVPVRLLIATRDGFVTPRSVEGLQARCRQLSRVDIDDGHWWPRTQPSRCAAEIENHISGRLRNLPPSR